MSLRDADCSWLPDHQLHVVQTLAHVDHTIERLLRLTHDYAEHGTRRFEYAPLAHRQIPLQPQQLRRALERHMARGVETPWNRRPTARCIPRSPRTGPWPHPRSVC
ncbi:hypothetical protein [Streptomyces mirabilis]|uniref:hypothetical protein n=1 Tax=Streptomyces mirabilis TaxID=68239 RepID=UPI0036B6740E